MSRIEDIEVEMYRKMRDSPVSIQSRIGRLLSARTAGGICRMPSSFRIRSSSASDPCMPAIITRRASSLRGTSAVKASSPRPSGRASTWACARIHVVRQAGQALALKGLCHQRRKPVQHLAGLGWGQGFFA